MIPKLAAFRFLYGSGDDEVDRIEEILDGLAGLATGWSLTQSGTYDAGAGADTAYGIATHTSGAQVMILVGLATGANVLVASNAYGGSVSNPRRARIGFKPSQSGASYATVSDVVNPYSTATYCDDAGAFYFKDNLEWNTGLNFVFSGKLYVMSDEESAHLVFLGQTAAGTQRVCFLFADDDAGAPNFHAMGDPGDTEKAFVLYFGALPPSTEGGVECEFTVLGTRYEGGIVSARVSEFDQEDLVIDEPAARVNLLRSGVGQKGLIDHRLFAMIRYGFGPDAYRIRLDDHVHYIKRSTTDGVTVWPADEPFTF